MGVTSSKAARSSKGKQAGRLDLSALDKLKPGEIHSLCEDLRYGDGRYMYKWVKSADGRLVQRNIVYPDATQGPNAVDRSKDRYKILGVKRGCSWEQAKAAFERERQKYLKNTTKRAAHFEQVNIAFAALADHSGRQAPEGSSRQRYEFWKRLRTFVSSKSPNGVKTKQRQANKPSLFKKPKTFDLGRFFKKRSASSPWGSSSKQKDAAPVAKSSTTPTAATQTTRARWSDNERNYDHLISYTDGPNRMRIYHPGHPDHPANRPTRSSKFTKRYPSGTVYDELAKMQKEQVIWD